MRSKALLIIFFAFSFTCASAQIHLPRLISDGMVLQRDTELNIWGWASAGENIVVTFNESAYKTKADKDGNWSIKLPAQDAGGPYTMTLKGKNRVIVQDILIGDVWVCSGQSNMELPLERVKEKYREIINSTNNTQIRQFLVPDTYNFKSEQKDFTSGEWKPATPENLLDFSAVAFFFAKELYQEYEVPIGLINSSLGGSPVESWMSEETLKEYPDAYEELQRFKSDSLIQSIEEADKNRIDKWYSDLHQKDEGIQQNWHLTTATDEWNEITIPGYWENEPLKDFDGIVWFKKEVDIPSSFAGKEASLWLGRIVDHDFAYVNGEPVGSITYQYPPRRYSVDPDILKEGKNTITVRVINQKGVGGFVPDKPYFLAVGKDTLNLSGTWKYKIGATIDPLESQTFVRWKPGGLFNAMIAPLLNYDIKGVIWYQGESNVYDPVAYEERFPAMISNWRNRWEQDNFPFIYVQLANFLEEKSEPVESNWARLRQAQLKTLSVPNTGMAVTIDLGEWNDIHPLNKEDVGKRLALEAKEVAYDESDVALSPLPVNASIDENAVIIEFKNAPNGLKAKDSSKLKHFAISNDGENFVWASAEIIDKNHVKVWNKAVQNPTVVRYAWADNPAAANLYNNEGLPASPFEIKINYRSDD
ncbi:MAG: sialate O-acetylesterase [Candidatus Cyclobacteriaceae bacterium M2_1C_046]